LAAAVVAGEPAEGGDVEMVEEEAAAAAAAGAGEEGADRTDLVSPRGERLRVEDLGASPSASVLGRGMRKDLVCRESHSLADAFMKLAPGAPYTTAWGAHLDLASSPPKPEW
jgi:hypothetical protein